jgi:ATP-dependent Lhr-like helicase
MRTQGISMTTSQRPSISATSAGNPTAAAQPAARNRQKNNQTITIKPPLHSALVDFHPVIREWFRRRFGTPTDAQAAGWPQIKTGRDVLIAAPTGSGKTLAAFLCGIDSLVKQSEASELEASTQIVYVSPLKALGNDIQRNLEAPLEELAEVAQELGYSIGGLPVRGEPVEPRVLRQAQDERHSVWPEIRVGLRTGDTSAKERQAFVKSPPHIMITTPESLYLMLTAQRSRETLRNVSTLIVDEIHALARDKRGSHLALSLTRLDHLNEQRPARIGLSATQKPVEEIAAFLVGSERAVGQKGRQAGSESPRGSTSSPRTDVKAVRPEPVEGRASKQTHLLRVPQDERELQPDCVIVDLGHQRDIQLQIEVPPSDLEAVAPREQWADVYDRIAGLVRAHRTTLVFVNTRRLSERVAHNLRERLGEDAVASHHGSLSRDRRLRVEQRLKSGDLQALVCTASLELGIDIGTIDLVCQIGSPRSVATFLQRVGRSGHSLGLRPQGRLFPTSRDELLECAALIRAVRAGRLDRITQPLAPLDILAQQIVAECACEDWTEDALYDVVRKAWPFRDLSRGDFDDVVEMLAEGVGEGAGRAPPLLHHDRINRVLRGRRGARMTSILNGGAIPEMADYRVVAEPDDVQVGTVNEDWAIESMSGDIFLLGSHSWRIKRVSAGEVRVEDAHGAPPTIPFWLGEAPGRTVELSQEVGRLRSEVEQGLDDTGALQERLKAECGLDDLGAVQIVDYLRATRDALGLVPTHKEVVFERFFDETGGMQLVVHAPFGARINKAWGLTLRKRFCVRFDFELQAAASDDSVVLSLGPQHSFPLEESFEYVTPRNAEASLRQAVLYAPVFPVRWRWDAGRALAVPRFYGARKVPPPIQRMRADDLLAAVFPAHVGCQENVNGPVEIPDHPLIRQAVLDCLHEAMDIDGLVDVLTRVESGEIRLHARDTLEPSPMAHEILSGKPFTYLDDAPLEERRTRAVTLRRALPESARELGALDQNAIDRVREEAWPQPRDAEEAHDALLSLVVVPKADAREWQPWLEELVAAGRAAVLLPPRGSTGSPRMEWGSQGTDNQPFVLSSSKDAKLDRLWFAAENLKLVSLLYPDSTIEPQISPPEMALVDVAEREDARMRVLRGWSEASGPISPPALGVLLGFTAEDIERGLRQLEALGFVLRGRFTPGTEADEYCDRRLLARIHRYTLDRLRREIDPVSMQDFMRFLLGWQHLTPDTKLAGKQGVRQAVARLEGFEAPAGSWERDLFAARVSDYRASWLDEMCLAGEVAWARLTPRKASASGSPSASRSTPVAVCLRQDMPVLLAAVRGGEGSPSGPKAGAAAEVLELLRNRGALFFDEIVNGTRRLRSDVERGLRELVAWGLVTADGFQGLRQLSGKAAHSGRRRSRESNYSMGGFFTGTGPAGRWALVHTPEVDAGVYDELVESCARVLLQRYGVIFRDLYPRESFALPWRDVLRALRRLEARGQVRGGRFVSGPAGEQYALPDAVDALRRVRRSERSVERVWVSAVDPMNLVGVLISGDRVPAQAGKGVLFIDGLPQAPSESQPLVKTPVPSKLSPRLAGARA